MITVTGGRFSENGLENNIKIGDTNCIVDSSTNGTITCEVQPKTGYGETGIAG